MDLNELLAMLVVFGSIFLIIRAFLEHRTRTKLIERGLVDENIRYLYQGRASDMKYSSLKWGILLVAIGSALFLGEVFVDYFTREMTVAFMFLLGGAGLLIFYSIAPKGPENNGQSFPPASKV